MEYNYIDVEYYLSKAPYMQLKSARGGADFIKKEVGTIHNYSKFIADFPATKCEPLEFLYLCHESLCALDEPLFEDFINSGWRGVVWASFLAAISPLPKTYMKKHLHEVDHAPHNQWIVALALASLSNEDVTNHSLLAPIYAFKKNLSLFSYEKLPLRKWPSEAHLNRKRKENALVLDIYHQQGADAALKAIKENQNTEYDLSYPAWVLTQKST